MKQLVHTVLFLLLLLLSTIGWSQPTGSSNIQFTSTSGEAVTNFREGLKFADLSEAKKARTYFEKAVGLDPKLAVGYTYLALVSVTPQEFTANLNKAKENLGNANDWEKLFYQIAETYLNNDVEKRLSAAKQMVSQFPTLGRSYTTLGQAYADGGDYDKARSSYMKAVEIEPSWPGGFNVISSSFLFEEPKDFKKAELYANKLVSLMPTSGAYILLGDTYRAQNNLQKADAAYAMAVEADKEAPEAYYKRGHVLSFAGEYDKARELYRKAAALDATPTFAMENVAATYLHQNAPDKAINFLTNELKTGSGISDAQKADAAKYNYLTDIITIAYHTNKGQLTQTMLPQLETLSNELGQSFKDADAQATEKSYLLSWKVLAALANNKVEEANARAVEMKTALANIHNPRKLETYEFVMGQIAYRQKEYKKAIGYFMMANKQDIYNQYWLAKAYEADGQSDMAKKLYAQIAVYNFNSIGYALVRTEAKKKS
ncbi:tetratricopeptide repeat protein [Flavisolibacter ginsenosidimutans]|uniref:Tetratricopeptide repeat protein n=1 Tax=Flavisolibacter ginsenosidimutans TaxID=661481 RepID=A0A5B8UDE7_9BACT|nr:tetratricopeptide repeat protein [Flavisolibacter ginsenosidimutans]QEC54528.1 tetratricopeptide repeat protein [Flavisolibacter ginsenosidimutans]